MKRFLPVHIAALVLVAAGLHILHGRDQAPANLTYQTPDDYSRFQGEQQEAFWKWLEPAVRPASR